jgi:integrase
VKALWGVAVSSVFAGAEVTSSLRPGSEIGPPLTGDIGFALTIGDLQLARVHKELDVHWDQLKPAGFSARYEPQTDFLRRSQFEELLARLHPDNAARAAFMVGTGCEWGASETALRSDAREDFVHLGGTKNLTRDREVPLVRPWQRELVDYALEHGQGKDGLIFRPNTSFTHALYRGCEAITTLRAIAVVMGFFRDEPPAPALGPFEMFLRISSHDLRRTFGTWLRADGLPVSEVAAMLGHRDSRMAERVYARLPSDLLRNLLADLCQPAAGKRLEMGGKDGEDENAEAAKPLVLVPGTGIEPVTRGFSVPCSTN